ncbi:unnamed protein product [Prunus armeniaca]
MPSAPRHHLTSDAFGTLSSFDKSDAFLRHPIITFGTLPSSDESDAFGTPSSFDIALPSAPCHHPTRAMPSAPRHHLRHPAIIRRERRLRHPVIIRHHRHYTTWKKTKVLLGQCTENCKSSTKEYLLA